MMSSVADTFLHRIALSNQGYLVLLVFHALSSVFVFKNFCVCMLLHGFTIWRLDKPLQLALGCKECHSEETEICI